MKDVLARRASPAGTQPKKPTVLLHVTTTQYCQHSSPDGHAMCIKPAWHPAQIDKPFK